MSIASSYNGIVLNFNAPARGSAVLTDIVYSTFVLPGDYARGTGTQVIPPLTGFQVFAQVDPGQQAVASITWRLDRLSGSTWVPVSNGASTRCAQDGAVWFNLPMDPPVAIAPSWLSQSFRLGIQGAHLKAQLS